MKKIFLLLLFAFFVLPVFAEECINCEEIAHLTPVRLILAPDEVNYFVKIMLYNVSKPSDPRPMPNAVIIIHRYNASERFFEKVYTDQNGIAIYNFSKYKDECYNYQIMFCSCNDTKVRECCLKINNIDITKPDTPYLISGIKDAPNLVYIPISSEIIYDYHSFPATSNYAYCKPKSAAISTTPAFCLPLAVIFALLGGSLVLTGRNPLRGFEIGGARVGKHIRYDSRGRGAGYSFMSGLTTVGAVGRGIGEFKEGYKLLSTDSTKKMVKQQAVTYIEGIKETKNTVKDRVQAYRLVSADIAKFSKKGETTSKVGMVVKGAYATGKVVVKEMAGRAASAALQTPLTIVGAITSPFQRISTGSGPGVGMTIGQLGSKGSKSPLSSLLSILPSSKGKEIEEKYNDLLLKLNSYRPLEMKRLEAKAERLVQEQKDLQNQISLIEKSLTKSGETKSGISYTIQVHETESSEEKIKNGNPVEIEISGRKIKIIGQTKDGLYIYEENGKQKIAGLTDSVIDVRTLNQIREALHDLDEVNKGKISAVRIQINVDKSSGSTEVKETSTTAKSAAESIILPAPFDSQKPMVQTYLITKEGSDILIKNADTSKIIEGNSGLGELVLRIYNDAITQNKNFVIGSKNENLAKVTELRSELTKLNAEYNQTVAQIQQYKWIARNDLLNPISEKLNDVVNKELRSQKINEIDDNILLNQLPLISEIEEYRQYKKAANEYYEKISMEYAAKKLGVPAEDLEKYAKAAGYENDIKGYLKSEKWLTDFAKPGLKAVKIADKVNNYFDEIKDAERNFQNNATKFSDSLDKVIREKANDIRRNGSDDVNKEYQELEGLRIASNYVRKRADNPYNPVEALESIPPEYISSNEKILSIVQPLNDLKQRINAADDAIYYDISAGEKKPPLLSEGIKQRRGIDDKINETLAYIVALCDSIIKDKSKDEKTKLEKILNIINGETTQIKNIIEDLKQQK